ncbi:MAG: type II restriction endonuclease [Nanoarchaeota archaeon]
MKLKKNRNLLFDNMIESIISYEILVDWKKIEEHIKKIEKRLNILNYLIGKENIEKEFFELLQEYPEVVTVFPILVAWREDKINILLSKEIENSDFKIYKLEFKEKDTLSKKEIEEYYKFFKNSGLERIIKSKKIKNLVDYVFGVEVGLDTHARKNRVGKLMERIIELYLQSLCKKYNDLEYLKQATAKKIEEKWGIKVPVDKVNRKFDFAVFNKNTEKLFIIEVNFYNSQGSKLKSVAGEFITLNTLIRENSNKNKILFIWITDGKGWNSVHHALEECIEKGLIILNLHMVFKEKLLEKIILG